MQAVRSHYSEAACQGACWKDGCASTRSSFTVSPMKGLRGSRCWRLRHRAGLDVVLAPHAVARDVAVHVRPASSCMALLSSGGTLLHAERWPGLAGRRRLYVRPAREPDRLHIRRRARGHADPAPRAPRLSGLARLSMKSCMTPPCRSRTLSFTAIFTVLMYLTFVINADAVLNREVGTG